MSVESMARVLLHSRAKGTAKLVLVGIANHDGDGGAWPSVATLMRYANADRRTVQRSIQTLVDMGELVVHAQDGGTHKTRNDQRPNRYEITVSEAPQTVADGAAPMSPRGPNGAAWVTERGGTGDRNGAAPTPPEPSMNHPEPSNTSSSPQAATVRDPGAREAFEAFWSAYPRKVGKAAARKKFGAVVRQLARETRATVDLSVIVAGAERMAADPNLPETQFIPHPATWLNQRRWDDPPYPPRAGRANTTTRVGQAFEVAQRLAEADGHHAPAAAIGGGR